MTIKPTHSLNEDGLNNLHKRLQYLNNRAAKPRLVAVVPKGQSVKYTPQPSNCDLRQFRFFKMELNLPDGVFISITWQYAVINIGGFIGILPGAFLEDEMTKRVEDLVVYPEDEMTKQPEDSAISLDEN